MKVPLNLEIENRGSRTGYRRLITNTNHSNYDHMDVSDTYGADNWAILPKSSTNEDLANPTNWIINESSQEYAWDNYYCLPVEERNYLWNVAREK